jgi:hypothetical protein
VQSLTKDGSVNSNNWISNLLPDPKNEEGGGSESLSSQQTSKEASPANTPVHYIQLAEAAPPMVSPQKAVNFLPAVPETSTGRKLSDREKRDCEVIGKYICLQCACKHVNNARVSMFTIFNLSVIVNALLFPISADARALFCF